MKMIDLDFNNKLEVTIHNKKPVALSDLTLSLLGISQQYQKFVESATTQDYQANSELYIKEVRKGSIIVELIAQTMPIVPLIWSSGSLNEWLNYAKNTIEWLLGKAQNPPKELTKQDFKQWHSILEPVAQDSASQLNITVSDGGTNINQFFINSQEANAAQNEIKKQLNSLEAPEEHIQKRRIMYWNQTKFDNESNTGDKAIIESITKKPLKVIFENTLIKDAILAGSSNYRKPWQKLAYVVDVEVQTINNQPKAYTIINYYPDETFDPLE